MGAGKNEVAKRLALLSSLPVVEISYARKLKESVAALFGITLDDIEVFKNQPDRKVILGDWHGYRTAMTFREFLQRYGTEAHRDVFGEDFWLDAALPLPAHAGQFNLYGDALYVVTDMRFPNERHRVLDLGGVTVGIIGPFGETGEHVSEQALSCDVWLDNTIRDDNFTSLDKKLRRLLDSL